MEQDDVVCWLIQAWAEPLQIIMIGELYLCLMAILSVLNGDSGTTHAEASDGQTVLVAQRHFRPSLVSVLQLLNHKFQRGLAQRDGKGSV